MTELFVIRSPWTSIDLIDLIDLWFSIDLDAYNFLNWPSILNVDYIIFERTTRIS